MSVPLIAGETFVGVLSLYSGEPEGLNDDRGRLIQMIAPHLATAIMVRNATAKGAPVAAEKAQAAVPLRLVFRSLTPSSFPHA